ncbi:MAG: 50S ribosomal protein L29 [archaeon]|jgi:large subunit ribosomal protein L29
MTKKNAVTLNSIQEIENKVRDLKLDLAKEKGLLASKTKSTNPSKKITLKKQIARLLTKKNQIFRNEETKQIVKSIAPAKQVKEKKK